jgi:AraC family transcriptional regulator
MTEPSAVPELALTSAGLGWEGLAAQSFREPAEIEGWLAPASADITLIVFTGSPLRLARRPLGGPWREQVVRQGDLILQPGQRTPYEVRWRRLAAASTQTLHLRLDRGLVAGALSEADADPASLELVERAGFQDPLLAQLGFALWRELEQQGARGKLYAQSAARLLAVHLAHHYSAVRAAAGEPAQRLTPQQLSRVIDFIQAHLDQDIPLDALAQQAGFSAYHFARLFRQTTGTSPHQFVLSRRVEHAQQLLGRRDGSLAEIALACGFASQSHFTQVFKRQLGLTPRAYRRERTGGAGF